MKPTPREYAIRILDALISGELRDGIRVSHLIYARSSPRTQDKVREALRLLEGSSCITVRKHKDDLYRGGRHPACVFLREGLKHGQ